MNFDYRYTVRFSTLFTGGGADPIYTLSGWNQNPYQKMELVGIRPACQYVTAAGKIYVPSLIIQLAAPGLVVNYRDDYSLSAPTPAGSSKDAVYPPSLLFPIDSKLMGQVFLCYGLGSTSPWLNILVSMANQFGAGPGTTVPNGGTSYSLNDQFSVEIDFFFKVIE